MMITITTQQDARPAQTLGFCYYCGEAFGTEAELIRTRDHIPPRAVFHEEDRNWPLTVPCHHRCNQERSMTDVKIAQLVGVARGQHFDTKNFALDVAPLQSANGESPIGILSNLNMADEIWRWVRGFHAALYQSYLPADRLHGIHEPVPKGELTARGLQVTDDPHVRDAMKQVLLRNLEAEQIDGIRSNNGKLLYSCVWVLPPLDTSWGCCFGLRVYDWKNIGDPRFPRHDCFGWYTIDGEPPTGASIVN